MVRTTAAFALFVLGVAVFTACSSGDSTGGMMSTGSAQPTIADIQNKIFTPRCATSGCHTGPNPENGLDLSAGQASTNLINVPATWDPNFLRVEPRNAADSYLYMKLVNDPRIMGEQMPKGGPYLSSDELGAIFDWIEGGSPSRPGY